MFLKPYVILDKKVKDGSGAEYPIRIGLIGFVPPQVMTWDSRHLHGKAMTRDIVKTAQAWVPQMKEQGADIIIALSHSGMGTPQAAENLENASILLAGVDGIDAIVTGPGRVRVDELDLLVANAAPFAVGTPVRLAMRPEEVRTRSITADTPNSFEARIGDLAFLGSYCRAHLEPTGSRTTRIAADFSTNAMRDLGISPGQVRAVAFPPEALHVFAGSGR